MLEVDNIELSFDGKKILWGIYLKAEKGKITSILGRNGCGKTSLLQIIFGSLTPKYATIRIDKTYIKSPLYRHHPISFLPQDALLPKNTSIIKAFEYYNVQWPEFISIFPNFQQYKTYKVHQLSSGEIRILETYLILKKEGDIILLDEPFSFIAPVHIEKIKMLLLEEKENKTILLTDHYYQEILAISDAIYMIQNGHSKPIADEEDLKNLGYLSFNPK